MTGLKIRSVLYIRKRVTYTPMSWNNWLNDTICCSHAEYISRRAAIMRLCRYGLIPFLRSYGYVVYSSHTVLASKVANGLYSNRGMTTVCSNWSFSRAETKLATEDHKSHYYHVLDPDVWAAFWEYWAWAELDTDRQNDIQEFMWTQLDLEASPQTQVVNDLMGVNEEAAFEEYGNKDIYLKEAAESNEWGGIRR